jgi:uncharacterized protein (TIGR02147 family)
MAPLFIILPAMRKSVFEFIDYRKFLGHYYQERKKEFRHFSFRTFAQKADIKSPSFIKHVIDGKRNLTRPVTEKLCMALKLSPKETLFFKNLVLFNQAKTALEKQEHYAVLRSLAGTVKESVLQARQYDYFDKWYTPVIRELVCLEDFGDNFEMLAKTVVPPVTSSEARKAVENLLRLGLIERRFNGGYRQKASAITADSAITSLALRSFVETMLGHAQQALHSCPRQERNISGLTMGISKPTFDMLNAEIEAFKDRLKTIVNSDKEPDRVYQLNLSMFPVSRNVKEGRQQDKGGPA